MLLKLFHGWEVGPAVMIEHVRRFRAEHVALLERYAHYDEMMTRDNEPPSPYWLMTVSCGQHSSRAFIAWCDETIAKLEQLPAEPRAGGESWTPGDHQHPEVKRMSVDTAGAALLLDGRRDDDATLALAHDALADGLAAGGWAVDDWTLRDDRIAWCAGCFKCWTQTPGVCAHHDDGRKVAERWVPSDLTVLLTPVTFGGYSSELKKALDHVIPILLPFMRKREGETRHPQRYELRRDLLVVGTVPAGQAARHRGGHLQAVGGAQHAQHAAAAAGPVACSSRARMTEEVRVAVTDLLATVGVKTPEVVRRRPERGGRVKPPRTALLLVGSPKPGESTSESLGAYLLEALEKGGVKTQTLHVDQGRALRTSRAKDCLEAVASSDLVVLSFPLYVDSLPAPTTRALELIAAARAGSAGAGAPADEHSPAFLAICQSGFAEAEHSAVAIEICRNFARSAGFAWAGGLVMPEGGMISGMPHAQGGRPHAARRQGAGPHRHCAGRRRAGVGRSGRAHGQAGVPAGRLPLHGQLGLALAAEEAGQGEPDARLTAAWPRRVRD